MMLTDAAKFTEIPDMANASQAEDQALVRSFLDGDAVAFSRLVEKYRKAVYAVAYRFAGNHEEADDIAQETMIKAYENLHRFRGEASFKTWLLRIAANLSINLVKSGRIAKDSGAAPDDAWRGGEASPPLEGMMATERRQALRAAIARLPPKQRQTLLLKTFQNMTCEEVAAVMKCSPGTVKANVFNAVKRLKSLLNPGAQL